MNHFDDSGATNGPTPPDRASSDSNEHIDTEVLAAYVDEPEIFEQAERQRVEGHLATCRDCRQTLAELESVVRSLRSLSVVEPPQTFHLSPEMAGIREPVAFPVADPWYLRHLDKVRWTAAAVALLFVAVLTADLVVNGFGPTVTEQSSEAPASGQSEQPMLMAATEATGAGGGQESAQESAGDAPAPDMAEEEAAPAGTATSGETTESGAADEAETPEAGIMRVDPTPEEASPPPDAAGEGTTRPGAAAEEGTQAAGGEAGIMRSDGAEPTADGDDAAPETSQQDTGATVEQMTTAAAQDDDAADSRQYWRIAEFSLVVLFVLLTATMLILPRMRRHPR